MGSSRKTSSPAPIYTGGSAQDQFVASPSSYESTPRSFDSLDAHIFSQPYPRTDSINSNASANSTFSQQSRKSSTHVNVYTHCGRHSNQYLFGGWGDVVKTVFHKK